MRLIDAEDAVKKLQEYTTEMESDIYYGSNCGVPADCISEAIEECQTIDAEPMKHGEWIPQFVSNRGLTDFFECSVCNGSTHTSHKYSKCPDKYCKHCGAKMTKDIQNKEG